ncbi:transposase [Fusobacterium necrophorum]
MDSLESSFSNGMIEEFSQKIKAIKRISYGYRKRLYNKWC